MEQVVLPSEYSYSEVEQIPENTIIKFRIKEVTDRESAEKWVQRFSEENCVTWRVFRTFPKCGRVNAFHKQYRCQHSSRKKNDFVRNSKSSGCEAEMNLVVKRITKRMSSSIVDVNLLTEFPASVRLNYFHNHVVESQYRPMSEKVKQKLFQLYLLGHSPTSALKLLETDLRIEHKDNFPKYASDGTYLPTYSVISRLYKTKFVNESACLSKDTLFTDLEDYLHKYDSDDTKGKAAFLRSKCGTHYVIVLCTPIMLRAHQKLIQSRELVAVCRSENLDKGKHHVYVLVTPCGAGDIPLGVIITDTVDESVFSEGLCALKNILGDLAFYSSGQPSFFLTDTSLKESDALKEAFPKSNHLICQLQLLRSAWDWIGDVDHTEEEHRHDAYSMFKQLVFSNDEITMEYMYSSLVIFARNEDNEQLESYIRRTFDMRKDWVSLYRNGMPSRDEDSTMGVVSRIEKDYLFSRATFANILHLVDFIATRYESYWKLRLLDFCSGLPGGALITNIEPAPTLPVGENGCTIMTTDLNMVFTVTDSSHKEYFVDLEAGFCSCQLMNKPGKLCGHAFQALQLLKSKIKIAHSKVRKSVMQDLYFVASGLLEEGSSEGQNIKNEIIGNPDPVLQQASSSLHGDVAESGPPLFTSQEANLIKTEVNGSVKSQPSSDPDPPNTSTTFSHVHSFNYPGESIYDEFQKEWNSVGERILDGIRRNPSTFQLAATEFIKNVASNGSSEAGLLSGLTNFCCEPAQTYPLRNTGQKEEGPVLLQVCSALFRETKDESVGKDSKHGLPDLKRKAFDIDKYAMSRRKLGAGCPKRAC